MTRQAFLKKYLLRFAVSLTLLGLIVYTLYHVFASSSQSLMKTSVRSYSEPQIISGNACLFRDETVLTSPREGLINDLVPSGAKVSRGVPLSEVWECPEAFRDELQIRLDDLNRLIGILESSQLPNGTPLAEAGGYRDAASADYEAICAAIATGDWTAVNGLDDSLLTLLNRYASLTNPENGIEETLAELKAERALLLTGTPLTQKSNKASCYYYSRDYIDGYETIFTPEALNALDESSFSALSSAEPSVPADGFPVGKTVFGYEWSLAIRFDATDSAYLTAGESYSVSFPENHGRVLTFVCSKLIPAEDGAIAIFTSNEVLSDFVYLRKQTAEITVDTLTGYDVPENAIYKVNGVEGVYVLRDGVARFCRIEVIARKEGYYIIAEQGDRGEDYPALYDILITSGKDLYDGKVYQ